MNTMNRCINALKGFSYWRVALLATAQGLIHPFPPPALAQAERTGAAPFKR
jgi:hypothetical protein